MHQLTSLRSNLIRTVFDSAVLAVLTIGAGTGVAYFAKKRLELEQGRAKLAANAAAQVRELAASYLIPEQRAGRSMLLEGISKTESLNYVALVPSLDDLPIEFQACKPSLVCRSRDGKSFAEVFPVKEGNVVFGYLVKGQNLEAFGSIPMLRYIFVAFLTLLIVVGTMLWLIFKTHREVIGALKALEIWTEKAVRGEDIGSGAILRFSEIDVVGKNIQRIVSNGAALKEQAAVAELARQVAHDIRSPVNALRALLHVLKPSALNDDHRDLLIAVAQRINEIADTLIARNRRPVLGGSMPMSLVDAVQHVVSEKRAELVGNKSVTIKCELDALKDACVLADPAEMKRVISNLLNNAVESIDGRGQVLLQGALDTDFAKLEFIDTGRGMPADVLGRLGERGFTLGQHRGSGLGVYHAKKTLQACGGILEFSSRSGQGTCAAMRIPLAYV